MAIPIKYNPLTEKVEEKKKDVKSSDSEPILSYNKYYFLTLDEFKPDCDLVNIVLNDRGTYTIKEVRTLIQEFKNKRVI